MDEQNEFNRNQTGLEDRERPNLDDDRLNYDEEFASEAVKEDDIQDELMNIEDRTDDPDLKNVYGWIGVALTLISFFIAPFIFAIVGIILGFVARRGNARILGNFAIGIGVVSILVRLFLLPLM